jgi:putative ABC transport system permease protein
MESVVDSSLGFMKFPLYVMLAFAGIAVLLTIVGVFGVASQVVAQRTRELGIRRALGATRASLYRLVILETLIPAAAGIIVGVAVALSSGRVLDGLLYGVSATDVSTFVVTSLVLGTLTVIACVAPARRAAGVDPARTLRND